MSAEFANMSSNLSTKPPESGVLKISDCLMIPLGTISLISNLLLFYVMTRQKSNWTNFTRNALHYTAANLIFSLSGICLPAYRRFNSSSPVQLNLYSCAVLLISIKFGGMSLLLQSCAMSVDRFIAIAFPIFYHKYMQQSCVLSFNWLIWALGVGLGAVYPAMSIQKTPNLWFCTSSTITTSTSNVASTITYMMVSLFNILTYLVISLITCTKAKLLKKVSTTKSQDKKERKMVVTVGLIISSQFVFWTVPFILLDWAQTANVELANVLMSNTVCFALFNAFLTLPIYLATVEQLRNDFFRILKIKEVTTVQPLRSQTQSVAKPKTSP